MLEIIVVFVVVGVLWGLYDELWRTPRKARRRTNLLVADERIRQEVRAEWAREELDRL